MRILLLLTLLLLSACASSNKAARFSLIHTEMGTGYLKDKKYSLAFRELFTAIELDSRNPIAHNNLALAYIASKKPADAERHFKEALNIQPQYTDARTNLAALYLSQKKYSLAMNELKIAKQDLTYTEPEKLNASLGAAYFYLGNFKHAEEALRNSILADRKYCASHRYLGPSLYHLNLLDRAQKAIEHAIALCKENKFPELFYYGGLTYMKLNDNTKAIAKWNELESFFPNHEYTQEALKYKSIIESKL